MGHYPARLEHRRRPQDQGGYQHVILHTPESYERMEIRSYTSFFWMIVIVTFIMTSLYIFGFLGNHPRDNLAVWAFAISGLIIAYKIYRIFSNKRDSRR